MRLHNYEHILKQKLTLESAKQNCSRRQFLFLILSRENKAKHFMWIVCPADDSHEMLSLIFSEKQQKKNQNVICCSCDWHFKGWRWVVPSKKGIGSYRSSKYEKYLDKYIFLFPSSRTYTEGTHWNCLIEEIPITHSIIFYGKIKMIIHVHVF